MKNVLAFGDSLTWGADPTTGLRHPPEGRWPEVLAVELGSAVTVVSEGLGGRTTCYDDHAGPACRNGAKALQVALASHMPLDLVIVMLGTNDIKPVHGGRADGAFSGMRRLAQVVDTFPYKPSGAKPKLLIVAPPACGPSANGQPAAGRSVAESERLAPLYRKLADELGHGFFDAGSVASASTVDGVHLEAVETAAIGRALVAPVLELLG
ncbi:SGNH/GDSL hydrolase family protein [Rhizobium sp. RM]|uniref:SGNH/GDSL hydrolase family protein n=1 Tax=Rhizobium sp. RM TaxID=2748079 RepID=UPI00110E4786|nr:SGNH/GDSL hydrolase family protein [Rhizobium sp. RM]NWJ25799.1 SGNH/GDSL hydrolase family protein [Rhizobium sp. RM]TMV21645.1 arylesterase [Rhizobium sp. Td3]